MRRTIRLNESQLNSLVTRVAKKVLRESQYSDLSNDDYEFIRREVNDMPTDDDYGLYNWKIWKLRDDDSFLKIVEDSVDSEDWYDTKEEALQMGLRALKKYNNGKYQLYITDGNHIQGEVKTNNGKIIYKEIY